MTSVRTHLRKLILHVIWYGAMRQYRSDKPIVIAVGGSVGKTSTKEAVAEVFAASDCIVTKTHGNMATDFGVALSLLGYTDTPPSMTAWLGVFLRSTIWPSKKQNRSKPHYYVLEYSSDAMGDTAYLTKHIPPVTAILATLVPVHMEQYKTVETMVEETISLIDALPESGLILANYNDEYQRKALTKKRIGNRAILWYGKVDSTSPKQPGVWAHVSGMTQKGIEISLFNVSSTMDSVTKSTKGMSVQTSMVGEYQLSPVIAAAAVGGYYKIPTEKLSEALTAYVLPAGRGRLIEGRNGLTIIDDTANASPEAVKAGLSVLKPYAGKRRRVAILGTMNELGEVSESAHKEIAEAAAEHAQFFVALGIYAPIMVATALKAGMTSDKVMGFATPEQFLSHMSQLIKRNDVVYVKASQNGMYLERIVRALMAHPEHAPELLVRQGTYWHNR